MSDEFSKLDVTSLCAEFVETAKAQEATFKRLGRIFFWLQVRLEEEGHATGEKPRKIFPVLQQMGISKGMLSHASYGAKVYARVQAGEITEEEYSRYTYDQCKEIAKGDAPRPAPGKGHKRAAMEKAQDFDPETEATEMLVYDIDANPRGDIGRAVKLMGFVQDALLATRDCLTDKMPPTWNRLLTSALTPVGMLRFEMSEHLKEKR